MMLRLGKQDARRVIGGAAYSYKGDMQGTIKMTRRLKKVMCDGADIVRPGLGESSYVSGRGRKPEDLPSLAGRCH
jgi:hypothetical protein